MVTSPDYVYGIIDSTGEYGFEHRPPVTDDPVLSRVQSLAGSFQWIAGEASDPIVIAVDRGTPDLLARFTTDPGDPDGRMSLRMHVWLCRGDHELAARLDSIWPEKESLPRTRQEFLEAVKSQSDGRLIVGTTDQFTAIDFTRNWGARTSSSQPTTVRRPNPASRNAQQQRVTKPASSIWPKLIATLMTLVALGSIGVAAKLYWDFERASTAAAQAENELRDAEDDLAKAMSKFDSAHQANQQNQIEIRTQRRTIEESRIKLAEREDQLAKQIEEVDRLNGIIAINPEKNIQKELDDLRLLKKAVELYIADTSSARQQLEKAIPGQPSVLEAIQSKLQGVGNGKTNKP